MYTDRERNTYMQKFLCYGANEKLVASVSVGVKKVKSKRKKQKRKKNIGGLDAQADLNEGRIY